MPKDYPRSRRVGEQIQRELSHVIAAEFQDPRLKLVTITEVEVSRDLSHARVYVSVLGSDDPSSAVDALKHASGRLRQMLSHALSMRKVPELRFVEDRVLIEGSRLSALINKAVAEDGRHVRDEGSEDDKDAKG